MAYEALAPALLALQNTIPQTTDAANDTTA
jgi:hypothetical protein